MALALGACTCIGPGSVRHDRFDHNAVLADSLTLSPLDEWDSASPRRSSEGSVNRGQWQSLLHSEVEIRGIVGRQVLFTGQDKHAR